MNFSDRITNISHELLKNKIKEDSVVLDGTVGNGNDTLFLAKMVGINGKVIGFDIQNEAIENAKQLLAKNCLLERVNLISDTHTKIKEYIKEELDVAIFNLGYLPKGNRMIITKPETTLQALEQTLILLKDKGSVVITSYYGHKGGMEEKKAVEKYLKLLDSKKYNVTSINSINKPNNPPIIYYIEKILTKNKK